MPSLAHVTLFRFPENQADYKPKPLAQYLASMAVSRSTNITTFSIVQRQSEYKKIQVRALGDHFQISTSQGVVAQSHIPVVGSGQASREELYFCTARFGRSMKEFASGDGIRYQFDGPTDTEGEMGWSEQALEAIEV
jgi:hypothetical protein